MLMLSALIEVHSDAPQRSDKFVWSRRKYREEDRGHIWSSTLQIRGLRGRTFQVEK